MDTVDNILEGGLDNILEGGEVENPSEMPISEAFYLKMSRAMLFAREWFGEGSLAQVWVPMDKNNTLGTSDRLYYLHDDMTLSGYRQASTLFTFPAEPSFSSLPARVFASKLPEWTSSVTYYNHDEFCRMHLALQHKVCASLALPVFEDHDKTSCCAVFELVTTKERLNFDAEIDAICQALEIVELGSCRPPRLGSQWLSLLKNAALGEIKGMLYAICRSHQLPLALTWIPFDYPEISGGGGGVDVRGHYGNKDPYENSLICVDEMASYWKDYSMEGFVHACITHPLKPGQGIVGKSVRSNQPLFHQDVKQFHVSEYPLVHHARRAGLGAAIAIRLRSAYTGTDDYILEFFLPGLENIAIIMERIFRSLKEVQNIQLLDEKDIQVALVSSDRANNVPPVAVLSTNVFQLNLTEINENEATARRKKRSSVERSISLGELHQYFTGSTSTRVSNCLATTNRISRKKEIPRCPSRELNEVIGNVAEEVGESADAATSPAEDRNKDKALVYVEEEGSTSFNAPPISGGVKIQD